VVSKLDQLTILVEHRAFFSGTRDGDATTSGELNQAFVMKSMHSTKHRVPIDTEDCGKVFGERKTIAQCGFTF
jgi:hypothetical protein